MLLPPTFSPLWSVPEVPTSPGIWFVFRGQELLTLEGEPDAKALPRGVGAPLKVEAAHRIGLLGFEPCYAARALEEALPKGHAFEPLRTLFDRLPDELLAVAGRAAQVLEFERTHRFCGACAEPTRPGDMGRARRCPACGETSYPRLAPAMMALVLREGAGGRELLLARGTRFTTPIYSALAGFVEPSETLEDCVRREVKEEVGVEVRGLRYFGSQAWPFPHSLMVAFLAEHASGEISCQAGEIVDAQWFKLDALPLLPHRLSVARRLIDFAVSEGRKERR